MRSLTWEQATRRRLACQYLVEPAPASRLVEVARAVCGLQAQVLSAAEWALGARVSGVDQGDVRAELWERRGLVKTYGPRETLHLLPADELPLWMAAMRGRADLRGAGGFEAAGLDSAQAEAVLEAIGKALDGRSLTREELAQEVGQRAGPWAYEWMASTWGSLLGPAAYRGLLCFGPSQGSRVTFVRADQWVSGWQEMDPGEALKDVLRRYLGTYGPAAHADFAHWFALKPAEAQAVFDSLAGELEEVRVAGRRAWVLAGDARGAGEEPHGSLRLLPQYDAYLLGSGPRDRVVPAAVRERVRSYGRGRFEGATGVPVLLAEGVVAGIWERKLHGRRLGLRVEPFFEPRRDQSRQLEQEAARLGEFLGLTPDLTLGRLGES